MKFWDASAIIPLCVDEEQTPIVREIAKKDGAVVVWWGSIVESYSAFARLRRDRTLSPEDEAEGLAVLSELAEAWTEIEPSDDIREITKRLLQNYPLRAADSLQLAAAVVWSGKTPKGHHFVCLDARLREAAKKEGFIVLPSGF
jgi:predicted nucleic acid-binding protein